MKTFEQRFWSKVDTSGDCWEWTAAKDRHGYGHIMAANNAMTRAHRASYEMAKGPIPNGMLVDHICHNRSCVNPGHLRLATPEQNCQYRQGGSSVNKSGHRGVSWNARDKKWQVRAMKSGKSHSAGFFTSLEEAVSAAKELRARLYGEEVAA